MAPLHIYPAELNINKLSSIDRVFTRKFERCRENTLNIGRIKYALVDLLPSNILSSFDIFALFAMSDRFRLLSEPYELIEDSELTTEFVPLKYFYLQ